MCIMKGPSLQYCTMSAFGGDALQRKAMSHKSSFIIIDDNVSMTYTSKYGHNHETNHATPGWCKVVFHLRAH